MNGRVTVIQEDKRAIFIECNEPVSFKMGDLVEVKKYKRKRTLPQNRLYFAFLNWCISREGGGLIDKGHWSVDGLHCDIKAWIQSEYPNQFNVDKMFSSAELNTQQFTEFIDIVDRELIVKFFEIDTSRFFGGMKSDDRLPF